MTDLTESGHMKLHPNERHLRVVPPLGDLPERGMTAVELAYAEGFDDCRKLAFDFVADDSRAEQLKPMPALVWFLFGAASALGLFGVAILALRLAA